MLNVKKIVIHVQVLNVLNAKKVITYNHNNVAFAINLVKNAQVRHPVNNVIMDIILMETNVLIVLQIVLHAQKMNVNLVLKDTY